MIKTIYHNPNKGVQWEFGIWFNYGDYGTTFYLVPTLFYYRSKIFDDCTQERSFKIAFTWLFWQISIERYWGNDYKIGE